MKKKFNLITILLTLLLGACDTSITESDSNAPSNDPPLGVLMVMEPGEVKLLLCYEAHGGDLYEKAHYQFDFRGKTYTVKNDGTSYRYTVNSTNENGDQIFDQLENGQFSRMINGKSITLSQKEQDKFGESINSVVYFATLPHKLNDEAVNKESLKGTTILNEKYDVLEITFNQEGGGTDFDDEYLYWINSETKKIDYLAYNYQVNGGGVRFRSAYNVRTVGGIIFQDYVNYEAPVGTPLAELPELYEKGELIELSKIETENVINLTK